MSIVTNSTTHTIAALPIVEDSSTYKMTKMPILRDPSTYTMATMSIIKDSSTHTMGNSLFQYLDMKIHHYIKETQYKRIVVVGNYDRRKVVAKNEKGGKFFNWQRPTAELIGDVLYIHCPTGHDYVPHYASIIGSYLSMTGKNHYCVSYIPPTEDDCWKLIESSNLKDFYPSEFIVYGYGIPQISGADKWEGTGPFKWTQIRIRNTDVTFLGCEFCVWGDISGRLVQYLAQEKKIKRFVYIGKLGCTNPSYVPNQYLASGNNSLLNGTTVRWNGVFDSIHFDHIVKKGLHLTIPSVLMETREWLASHNEYDFLDPEIGHMGYAATKTSIDYGYMHVISDNLAKKYPEDLSNERMNTVLMKRKALLKKIRGIIEMVC